MRKSSTESPLRCFFLLANGMVVPWWWHLNWDADDVKKAGDQSALEITQQAEGPGWERISKDELLRLFPTLCEHAAFPVKSWWGLIFLRLTLACVIKSLGRCKAMLGISRSLGRTRSFYFLSFKQDAFFQKKKIPWDVYTVRVHK